MRRRGGRIEWTSANGSALTDKRTFIRKEGCSLMGKLSVRMTSLRTMMMSKSWLLH